MAVSQCQTSQLTFLQATLNALEAAAHSAYVALVYTLADLIGVLFDAAGVALAGVILLGNIFLAGVQAVVGLVSSAVDGVLSTVQSVANALGGQCKESKNLIKTLNFILAGLKALSNALHTFLNQITLAMNTLTALADSLSSGSGFAAYVKTVIH